MLSGIIFELVTDWKLHELAERAGVSPRTVRYYVQRGLLPAPVFRGRDTAYGEEHLLRLRAIRRLQERFLPLEAIQAELARLAPDEIRRLAEGEDPPPGRIPEPVVSPVTPAPRPSTTWRRIELAPGLELAVADHVTADVRALADALVEEATRRTAPRRTS